MAEVTFLAEQVERRPTAALVPYARNARSHDQAQIAQIAASMREFGWTYPVLIDEDDGILCGHGRILAAQKLKLVEVPVMVARGWSEAQKRAYILADNRLALSATWDDALLRIELSDLQSAGFDLNLTGFSAIDLRGIFSTEEGLTDPDEVPEAPAVPVSELGDMWLLGEHRLVCGDCTDKMTVELALDGQRPHLMVTDAPYGVLYDPDWRNKALRADGTPRDGRAIGKVRNDERIDWREAWALFPGDVAYCWHADRHASAVQASLEAVGFEVRSQIIWAKTRFAIGRGHYHWQHEPAWYVVRKGENASWAGDRKQSTLWTINHIKSETGHSTQKPVECMARPILNNSQPGDHVYDPFVGSGTTIIAAQVNKRVAHCVEIDPVYVDVCCLRFAAFTGVEPILADTGETFEQVKLRRAEAG